VQWRAELHVVEEVVAKSVDGTIWLRVGGHIVKASDAAGTLVAGMPGRWPAVHMRVSPLGEVIDVSVATGETAAGAREHAFMSLFAQPGLVVLPADRVEPGDTWETRNREGHQTSELLSVQESPMGEIAVISTGREAALGLAKGSTALGLHTDSDGRVTETSELRLLLEKGLVLGHTGEMEMRMNSAVSLSLPGGTETFDIEASLAVDFEVQLVAVNGRSPGAS
jgi:hypothetical protein